MNLNINIIHIDIDRRHILTKQVFPKNNWFCKYKIAHRGLHTEEFPENSLGAFENAKAHGFAIELDVRVTKDKEIVVFHDNTLERLCGKDGGIEHYTLGELKKFKILKTKYTIPTLQEVLDLIQGIVPIMIELKPVSRHDHIEEKVYNLIKDYKGDIAVKSFNPFSIMWFKKHAPDIPRGMLSSFLEGVKLPALYKRLIKNLTFFKWARPDFLSYDIRNLPNKYVKKCGVPVLAWTIRSEKQEATAKNLVSSIIFENYIPNSPTNY